MSATVIDWGVLLLNLLIKAPYQTIELTFRQRRSQAITEPTRDRPISGLLESHLLGSRAMATALPSPPQLAMAQSPTLSETQRWLVAPPPPPPPIPDWSSPAAAPPPGLDLAPGRGLPEPGPKTLPETWILLSLAKELPAPSLPWRVLGLAILLGYITSYQSLRLLVQALDQGVTLSLGSLLSGSGIALLGYLCWRLVQDLRQWWRDRRRAPPTRPPSYALYSTSPVLRIGESIALHLVQPLDLGDRPWAEGELRAQLCCQTSVSAPPDSYPAQQQTTAWQAELGRLPIAPGRDLVSARFRCQIPPGLPASVAVCGADRAGDGPDSFEVSWWLQWEITWPGLAPRRERLALAVQPEVVQ